MGYGRFDGVEAAGAMTRLYTAARLYVNFFQPCFKLKEKRREGAKVIKRYHAPSTPYERALAHPQVAPAVKQQLREQYRTHWIRSYFWLRSGPPRRNSAIASIVASELHTAMARPRRRSRCDPQHRA
jgi:hypothetical protein